MRRPGRVGLSSNLEDKDGRRLLLAVVGLAVIALLAGTLAVAGWAHL